MLTCDSCSVLYGEVQRGTLPPRLKGGRCGARGSGGARSPFVQCWGERRFQGGRMCALMQCEIPLRHRGMRPY